MSDYQPKFNHTGGDRFNGGDKAPERRTGIGGRFTRWLGKVIGTAIVLVLVIVLLPYAAKLAARILPDGSRNAVTTSAVLSHELRQSARLETVTVDDEGVLTSSVEAALLGEVQSVVIHYQYHASVGVDLAQAQLHTSGNQITLTLPPLEVLSDSLTPINIDTNDFWYPLTESRRLALIEEERTARREAVLAEAEGDSEMWQKTVSAVESTIGAWLTDSARGVHIVIARQEQTDE